MFRKEKVDDQKSDFQIQRTVINTVTVFSHVRLFAPALFGVESDALVAGTRRISRHLISSA